MQSETCAERDLLLQRIDQYRGLNPKLPQHQVGDVGVGGGALDKYATLILDDCSGPVIRYNSSVRIRGASSRSHDPPPTRVTIPHDKPWNDRTAMNWNTKYTYSQYIGMRLFQGAGMAAGGEAERPVRRRQHSRLDARPRQVERGSVCEAGVTAPLVVESPNSGPTHLTSRGEKIQDVQLGNSVAD